MLLLGRHRFAEGKEADVTKSVCGGAHITPWLHLPARLEFSTLSATQWLPSFHPRTHRTLFMWSPMCQGLSGKYTTPSGEGQAGSNMLLCVGGHVSYRCNTSGPAGLGCGLQSLRRSVSETVTEQCFPSIA